MNEKDRIATTKIEKIVSKVDGKEKGNAFLVDSKRALTVKHCAEAERVKLIFPNMGYKEVWAVPQLTGMGEEEQFVLLELETEVEAEEVAFEALQLFPEEASGIYGFDANFFADGRWSKLRFTGTVTQNENRVTDLLFDTETNKEADFSGLSGSPIIADGNIIGIVAQQNTEDGKAIAIKGISVRSSIEFFRANAIPVVKKEQGEYQQQKELTFGDHCQVRTPVTIAGIQDLQTRLEGTYKEKLEKTIELHRTGNISEAWDQLSRQITELDSDPYIRNEIKAEFYYRMSIWYLEDKNNIAKAQKKFDKAMELNPELDGCVFRAIKQSMTGENACAEDLLEPVNTVDKFNVYLQICINTGKIEKASEKYLEVDDVIPMNAGSCYLISIMMLLQQQYEDAEEYIEKALAKEPVNPFYHLIKGVIFYWKALPEDMRCENELYPSMLMTGILHLEEKELLTSAREEYRQAFQAAEQVNNEELTKVILNTWVNALSVDGSFENDIMEPLQIIQSRYPLNVTAMIYWIQRKMPIPPEVTVEKLEKAAKKESDKIGYVIAAIELSIYQHDLKKAKSLLHEYRALFLKEKHCDYWYEYIARTEDKKENLQKWEEELDADTEVEKISKNRLKCMFLQQDSDREQELETLLQANYAQTTSRLDLLNLITYYRGQKNWVKMLEYAELLVNKHLDDYGMLYQIQGLVELQEDEKALKVADALEAKKIWGTEAEISWDKMHIYRRMGEYDKAIAAGEKVWLERPSEHIALKLSELYALNGQESKALHILLAAEQQGLSNVTIYQKISVLYLDADKANAWEYAQKAVEASGRQPGILLWALEIANRTGRSDYTGQYLQEVISHKGQHLLETKSIEEMLEIIAQNRQETEQHTQALYEGKMFSHLFVDVSKSTYAEYFLGQWNAGNMVPLEFGGHNYREEQMTDLKQGEIVLDYSSCLLLQQLGILSNLLESMRTVYVSGVLFGVLAEEIRKVPVRQEELARTNYRTIEKCRDLKVEFVPLEIPEETAKPDAMQRLQAMREETAQHYGAKWVSGDAQEAQIRDTEVIALLYRIGGISEDTYKQYEAEIAEVRDNIIRELEQQIQTLYVDIDILEKWDEYNLLAPIARRFRLLSDADNYRAIQDRYQEILDKKKICEQLEEIRTVLLQYKGNGKLVFFPMTEEKDDMIYTNMLASGLKQAETQKIPFCVDDRTMTGYASVGENNIYNTFDLLQYLYRSHKITREKYCDTYEKAIARKIQYVVPDTEYVFYTLNSAGMDETAGRLLETDTLTALREYVLSALEMNSFLQKERIEHVNIPEREAYILCLHRESMDLIRKVWQSGMPFEKKHAVSNWILEHFSQFAFEYDDYISEEGKKDSLAVQLADLLIKGTHITWNENDTAAYYVWLDSWMKPYFQENPEMNERTIKHLGQFMDAFIRQLRSVKNPDENRVGRYMFAMGIKHMPEQYREALLQNEEIRQLYDEVYNVYAILLSEKTAVPQDRVNHWEKQILEKGENDPVTEEYKGISYTISWNYLLPGYPRMNIYWKEGESEKEMHFLLAREHGREKDDLSDEFEKLRKEKVLEEDWLFREDMQKMVLPKSPEYFKQYYDCETGKNQMTQTAQALPLEIQGGEMTEDGMEDNHNPIRLLHTLERKLATDSTTEDIMAVITDLFSYAGEESREYGMLYVLLLRYIWQLFRNTEHYRDNSPVNLMMWSYLWADQMMSTMMKSAVQHPADREHWLGGLQHMLGDIKTEGLHNRTKQGDPVSPETVNLYRICINGTLQLLSRYKATQQVASQTIDQLLEKYPEWMENATYYREGNLTVKSSRITANAMFANNFYEVVREVAILGKCTEKLCDKERRVILSDTRQQSLREILGEEKITLEALIYLLLLTREPMNEETQTAVQHIIEKNVKQNAIVYEERWQTALSYIVQELPEDFRAWYEEHELDRIGKKLCEHELTWEEAYRLVGIVADGWEGFVSFWEKNVDQLSEEAKKQIADVIGSLQYAAPYVYMDRLRKMRIRLEISAIHV